VGEIGFWSDLLGLPQFKELSTSRAYMDHQILFAISPIIGLETPALGSLYNMCTWPACGGGDGLV
jgi:hypothetical protein